MLGKLGSSYLRAENIKKGVNIFNVTGTLDYAEYFTGTAGSMLSRWFISKSTYVSSSSDALPKFITNGKSIGLPVNNALRLKYDSYGSDFSMRIPSYKDYRDLPTGGEFRIWVSSPSAISSLYMPLIQMRYYKIRRYGNVDMNLDDRDVGGIYTFSVSESSSYGLNTSYSANSIPAGSTTQLSTRDISYSSFKAVNDRHKFCGYVGLVVTYTGSRNPNDYVYITKITYHPN